MELPVLSPRLSINNAHCLMLTPVEYQVGERKATVYN